MTQPSRVLLFGPSGQVGSHFQRLAGTQYEVVPVHRSGCDLTDRSAVRETVLRTAPAVVVNAAAYTAVDKAETDEASSFAVNAEAPGAMAEAARELGIPLVHYSTDYVFNGQKVGQYREEDATDPLGVYGRTKLEGEQQIAARGGSFVVLRTSWVYGAEGNNFLRTMLRVGGLRPQLRIVNDQVGAPTSAKAIAEATMRILQPVFIGAGKKDAGLQSGVYHMTAGGSTSWFGFAEQIFALAAMDAKPELIPIPTSEYPTPARRPLNSVLSNDKFAQTFGFRLAEWQQPLHEVMEAMRQAQHV